MDYMSLLHMNSEDFENIVLNKKENAIVDFWATWCGPCKMLGPTIEEIASELDGKIAVGKVDVDENRELAIKYGVMSNRYLFQKRRRGCPPYRCSKQRKAD